MIAQSVDDLLTKLETKITQSKKAFMSELKLVDEGECLECISQIRNILPNELSEARLIKKDASNIIANAENQAKHIIQEANNQAQMLVADSQILKEATDKANETVQSAYNYANNIVEQAYAQINQLIGASEQHSRAILQAVLDMKQSICPQHSQMDNMPQEDNQNMY